MSDCDVVNLSWAGSPWQEAAPPSSSARSPATHFRSRITGIIWKSYIVLENAIDVDDGAESRGLFTADSAGSEGVMVKAGKDGSTWLAWSG